jgi:hypothetical protein
VRFPGAFVYDTEEAARWVCRFLTGETEQIRDARLAVAVHDVIDYWGIDLVRARVEARIVELVCHADAAAVWHYARDRLEGCARATCARVLAHTMFLAEDVDALDGHDVRALVDAYEYRTLTLFHGLARWLNEMREGTGVGALGAIHYAAAECVASSFFSTAGADMDAIVCASARAHVARLVLDLLGKNVTGKRKRYGSESAPRPRQDEVGCTAPDGVPPPVAVRADGTASIMGVEFAQTGVTRCSAVHFARGAIYVLGPEGSVVIRHAETPVPMPPIDAAAAIEYDEDIHALDAASGTFAVLRDGAWRESRLPSLPMQRRRGVALCTFHGAIHAIASDGAVLRYDKKSCGIERWGRCATLEGAPNSALQVADGEIHVVPA